MKIGQSLLSGIFPRKSNNSQSVLFYCFAEEEAAFSSLQIGSPGGLQLKFLPK